MWFSFLAHFRPLTQQSQLLYLLLMYFFCDENRSALYFFAFCVIFQYFAELFRYKNDPSFALAINLRTLKIHRLDGDEFKLGNTYSRRTDRLHEQIKSAAFSFCSVEQAKIFGLCELAVVAGEELFLRFDEFNAELVAFAEGEEGIERRKHRICA